VTKPLRIQLFPAELRLFTERSRPPFRPSLASTSTRYWCFRIHCSQTTSPDCRFGACARLPTVFGFREHVQAGGLISYGLNRSHQWRRAGEYAAKILKGAKPADLPVEMQPKLELAINLKTATARGITIPPSVMAFANDVIE